MYWRVLRSTAQVETPKEVVSSSCQAFLDATFGARKLGTPSMFEVKQIVLLRRQPQRAKWLIFRASTLQSLF